MLRAVIESVRLKPAVPLAAAEESWVVATDLAEALARAGTPFHQAHQIAGRLVLESVRTGAQAGRLDRRRTGRLRTRVHPRYRPPARPARRA